MLDLDLAMGAPGSDIDDGFALALARGRPGDRPPAGHHGQREHRRGDRDHADVRAARPARGADPSRCTRVRPGRCCTRQPLRPAARRIVAPATPAPGHGVLALIETVLAAPGELTLVAIGPLTNVALAMLLEPRSRGRWATWWSWAACSPDQPGERTCRGSSMSGAIPRRRGLCCRVGWWPPGSGWTSPAGCG